MSQGVSQSFVVISKCFKEKGREGRAGRMMGGEKMGMGQKDRDKKMEERSLKVSLGVSRLS